MLYTRKLGFGLRRAALLMIAATVAGIWSNVEARDVGQIDRADVVLPEGDRTLYLEIVPDLVMVRPGRAGWMGDLDLREVNRAEGAGLLMMKSSEALGGKTDLVDRLSVADSVDFAGPVLKLGGRTLGVGSSLAVHFREGVSADRIAEIEADFGLSLTREWSSGVRAYSLSTKSGFDTLTTSGALDQLADVEFASVNWYSAYAKNNYTSTFGGTSAAAANAAGVAAYVRSLRPDLDVDQVIQVMKQTALNGHFQQDAEGVGLYDEQGGQWSEGTLLVRGSELEVTFDDDETTNSKSRSSFYGYGVVNAFTAADYALSLDPLAVAEGFLPGGYSGSTDFIVKGEDGETTPPLIGERVFGDAETGFFVIPLENERLPRGTTSHFVNGEARSTTDSIKLNFLEWRLNDGVFQNATANGLGTDFTPWSFTVMGLQPGFNKVEVRVTDSEGQMTSDGIVLYVRRANYAEPSDPLFPYQWHLGYPTGFPQQTSVTPFADMSIRDAWEEFEYPGPTGGVAVAVIDDGISTDLVGGEINLVTSTNACVPDGSFDPRPTQFNSVLPRSGTSHGTSAACVIAGRANDYGGVGIVQGFPLIGVRVPISDDGRGGLLADCDLYDAVDFAVEHGASVIYLGLGPVLSDGVCFSPDAEQFETFLLSGAIVNAHSNDVLLVCAAGNTRDEAGVYGDFAYYGSFVSGDFDSMTGLPDPERHDFFERILVVGASTSLVGAEITAGGTPLGTAGYSNRGERVSLVAPSADPPLPFEPCFDQIRSEFLTLGIVTNENNLFGMGGNLFFDKFTQSPFPIPIEVPPVGATGIANYEALSRLYVSDDDNSADGLDFLNRGIIFYTDSGTIEIHTDGVLQLADASLTGFVTLRVRDVNNVITNQLRLDYVSGKFKYRRRGVVGSKESFRGNISLRAMDRFGNQFQMNCKEAFSLKDGVLEGGGGAKSEAGKLITPPDPPDPPKNRESGFRTKARVKLAGGGSNSTSGIIYHTNQDVATFDTKIDWALGTIYSPDVDAARPVNSEIGTTKKSRWTGNAVIDSDFAYGTAFDKSRGGRKSATTVDVLFSTPTKLGQYKASAQVEAGGVLFRSKSQGVHTAPNRYVDPGDPDDPDDEATIPIPPQFSVAEISHFVERVQFRCPGFSTTLTDRVPAGFASPYIGN